MHIAQRQQLSLITLLYLKPTFELLSNLFNAHVHDDDPALLKDSMILLQKIGMELKMEILQLAHQELQL